MNKLLVIPSDLEQLNNIKNDVDGFIIGIKDMCVNTPYKVDIDELDLLNDLKDKDIFICLNKNLHNQDLEKVKDILIRLNNYNIKGVMYYDVAIVSIYNSLDLNYDLVWSAEHLTTNYNTINYWLDHNVNYTYLSSDITEEEIINISKNTNSKLIVNLFGYLPMFVSKRHIVKNYLEYFNLNDKSKINYMEKEDKVYPIIDDKIATYVYSNNILNGIRSMININVSYVVLNSFNINKDKFNEVLTMFKLVNKENVIEFESRINSMFDNVDRGFLDTKTIYKVKKDEK